MPLTTADFAEVPGKMRIGAPIDDELVSWWGATFGGRGPREIAELLSKGLPGNVSANFTGIDALAESFSLEVTGSGGNASIWYNATSIDLRAAADGKGWMHEEDLHVAEPFRGRGMAQIVVGNAADVARSLGVHMISLTAQDVGAYVWARAGAVPRSWNDIARPVVATAGALLRQSRIDQKDMDLIGRLVTAGIEDPSMIRPLSGLRKAIEGPDGGMKSLGARLLVGTNWRGEIHLEDLVTKAMFRRWRRCRKNGIERSRQRGEPVRETSPGRWP